MSISDEVVSCTCVIFSRESFNTKRGQLCSYKPPFSDRIHLHLSTARNTQKGLPFIIGGFVCYYNKNLSKGYERLV